MSAATGKSTLAEQIGAFAAGTDAAASDEPPREPRDD
mgnify:CR=1 FL=1